MVYFITGGVRSGKSRRLLALYEKNGAGDGFRNLKVYKDNEYIGQDIVRLSTGESAPFSRRKGHFPEGWDGIYGFGEYSFSRSGLIFAEGIIDSILNDPAPAYIDELGPLELSGRGLCDGFTRLLGTGKDIYAVVRSRCLEDVISKFCITGYIALAP